MRENSQIQNDVRQPHRRKYKDGAGFPFKIDQKSFSVAAPTNHIKIINIKTIFYWIKTGRFYVVFFGQ